MNAAAFGTILTRGIGLVFAIAGLAALLPDLIFIHLFEPEYMQHRPDEHWHIFTVLWQSGMGHEMLSKLLNLIFGVLLLAFGHRVGKWITAGIPNNVA